MITSLHEILTFCRLWAQLMHIWWNMVKKLDFTFDTPQWFRYVAASQLLLDDCIAEKSLIEALLPVHQLHLKCGRGVVQQFLVQFCSCLSGGRIVPVRKCFFRYLSISGPLESACWCPRITRTCLNRLRLNKWLKIFIWVLIVTDLEMSSMMSKSTMNNILFSCPLETIEFIASTTSETLRPLGIFRNS